MEQESCCHYGFDNYSLEVVNFCASHKMQCFGNPLKTGHVLEWVAHKGRSYIEA